MERHSRKKEWRSFAVIVILVAVAAFAFALILSWVATQMFGWASELHQ